MKLNYGVHDLRFVCYVLRLTSDRFNACSCQHHCHLHLKFALLLCSHRGHSLTILLNSFQTNPLNARCWKRHWHLNHNLTTALPKTTLIPNEMIVTAVESSMSQSNDIESVCHAFVGSEFKREREREREREIPP